MRFLLLALAATLLIASPAAAAPTWLAPVNLGAETTSPPDSSSIGRVALGADGTAVAAWAQNIPGTGNWVLQVARRKPGQAYGGAVTVPATTGVETLSVRVGVDAAGSATIIYRQGGALVILPWPASSAAPGAKQPLGAGSSPELAVGRGGTAVAAWIDEANPNAPLVRAAVRPGASGNFGPATPISDIGNGALSISGLRVAVGDGGHAAVVWSRVRPTPNLTVVEGNVRAPGGNFKPPLSADSLSETQAPALSTEPSVAVDASGRSTALWTHGGQVKFAEHVPGQLNWSGFQPASQAGATASTPVAAATPNGVVAAWVSNGRMEAAVRTGGGAFGGFRTLSGPSMDSFQPLIAVGRNGDALIAWLVGDGKALFNVQRKANGTYGPLLTAVSDAGQPAGEFRNFFEPSIGMDDQGNGVAAWTRDAFRNGASHYRFQSGSFDAAAPTLSSSVPPGAQVGAPIGMAAAASDRVSPVGIVWRFGDGATATGGAVSHAFGSPGAFTVTVTATDAAGNQASRTHPVLIAAGPPPPKKRIRVRVRVTWALQGSKIALVKMVAPRVPKRTKAQVTCKGKKKCPFKRKASSKRRKGKIVLFKEVSPVKALASKKRNFRGGQRVELRLTKPGFIGQVVRYKIKTGKLPVGRNLCLPPGTKKPRTRC